MKDGDEPGCLHHHLTAGLTAKSMGTSSNELSKHVWERAAQL